MSKRSLVKIIIAVIDNTKTPSRKDFDNLSDAKVFCLLNALLDKLYTTKKGKRYPQAIKLLWVQRFLESS